MVLFTPMKISQENYAKRGLAVVGLATAGSLLLGDTLPKSDPQEVLDRQSLSIAGRFICELTGVTDLHQRPPATALRSVADGPYPRDTVSVSVTLTPRQNGAADIIAANPTDRPYYWFDPRITAYRVASDGNTHQQYAEMGSARHYDDSLTPSSTLYPLASHPVNTAAEIYVSTQIHTDNTDGTITERTMDTPCGTMVKTANGWERTASLPAEPFLTERAIKN